jgi:hypothetical protein
MRYVSVVSGDEDEEGHTEELEFQNVGNAVACNVSILPFNVLEAKIKQRISVPTVNPIEPVVAVEIRGGLRSALDRARKLMPEPAKGDKRPPIHLKVQLVFDWEQKPEGCLPVDYMLTYKGWNSLVIRRVALDETVMWTDLEALGRDVV